MFAVGRVLSAWLEDVTHALNRQQFDYAEFAEPDSRDPIAIVTFRSLPDQPVAIIGAHPHRSQMQRLDTPYQQPVWEPAEHQLIGDAPQPGTGRRMRWGQIDVRDAARRREGR